MKTLLIAPNSDLPYRDAEIQRVINLLAAKLVIGEECTVKNVLLKLTEENFDLVWFAGHGLVRGLVLAENEILESDELIQHMRGMNAAVFLNTCTSFSVAMSLNESLSCEVIATVTAVDDIDAYRTGTLLAARLADGLSFSESYNKSRPGDNQQYIYLPSRGKARTTRHDRLDDILNITYQLAKKIDDLKEKILYNETRFWEIMKERDMNLNIRLGEKTTTRNRNKIIFGSIVMMMNLIFVYSDIRLSFGVSASDAFIVALITLPIGGYFVLTGLGFEF